MTSAARFGYAFGVACIVAGGLLAAVTGPLHLAKGSWAAAYLVLIAGVAQCVLSRQDQWLQVPGRGRREWIIPALWITGNALVITGALTATPIVTDAGGGLLWVTLVLALLHTRHAAQGRENGPVLWVLRLWYFALIVSIPIGLLLTHLRSGA